MHHWAKPPEFSRNKCGWLSNPAGWQQRAGWLRDGVCTGSRSGLCRSRAHRVPATHTDTGNTSAFETERSSPQNKKRSRQACDLRPKWPMLCTTAATSPPADSDSGQEESSAAEVPRQCPLRLTHTFFLNKDWDREWKEWETPNLAILNILYFGGGVITGSIHCSNTTPPRKAVGRKLWSPADFLGTEKNKKKNGKKEKNVIARRASKGFKFTAYPGSLHVAFHWSQPLLAATR